MSVNEETKTTILILSKTTGSEKVNLIIRQFSLDALEDADFQPEDKGFSKINLDKDGLEEFIEILQQEIR